MRHRPTIQLVAAIVVLLAMAPTATAQEPEDVAEFAFTPGEGPPGTTITITGRCVFRTGQAGDTATVGLFHDPPSAGPEVARATMTPAADGAFSGSLVVPIDAAPGPHLLAGQCSLTDFAFGVPPNVPFTITGPAPTTTELAVTTTTVLARTGTGSKAGPLLVLATLLLVGGLTLVSGARRRRAN